MLFMGLTALMMFKYVRNQAKNFQNKNGLKRSNPLSGAISVVALVILSVVMNKEKLIFYKIGRNKQIQRWRKNVETRVK